ncbi:uncharacterized protein LOC133728281 [Rosa rugosa]|uniref:uncharacterized protein LOC133728281 n=1 Tax=Rosa rugosa TaxID=74645 RepID=UPI002B415C30|nr:uncharacterized protein LOC133728281 [Rosa rugosa]
MAMVKNERDCSGAIDHFRILLIFSLGCITMLCWRRLRLEVMLQNFLPSGGGGGGVIDTISGSSTFIPKYGIFWQWYNIGLFTTRVAGTNSEEGVDVNYEEIIEATSIGFSSMISKFVRMLDLEKGMMDYLYAKCTPCITDCNGRA